MIDTVIKVENLSKAYRIGLKEQRSDTLGGAITSWLRSPFRNYRKLRNLSDIAETSQDADVFWALRDVSFDVQRGDILGIIGKNGAGKSTLLKILSKITDPTQGNIKIIGRVAALLEVGTGFNPDLSGRENTYLNGTILGMTKKEIDKKFDEIVDFSGVEQFIDTPVKRYSSGMKVRLGFAVAAHLEPEVLIVDEVLAVGDAEFQKKCLGKMKDVSSNEGRTVLFVSHNMTAVKSLCNKGLLLEHGTVRYFGDLAQTVNHYIKSGEDTGTFEWNIADDERLINNDAYYVSVKVGARDSEDGIITTNSEVEIKMKAKIVSAGNYFFECHLLTISDEIIFISTSKAMDLLESEYDISVLIPGDFLNDGVHKINLSIVKDHKYVIHRLKNSIFFEVYDGKREIEWHGKWDGFVRPKLNWTVK
jgi:lipopolysaccharide transport system ATP-binding protein